MLISAVQQSESVMYVCMYTHTHTHTHTHTLFKILFPCSSLQSIQKSSICYMVGPYHVSVLSLLVTSDFASHWTVACQAPLSMEFFRQEYWSGLPFPSPGDLHKPGTKPMSLSSSVFVGGFFTTVPPGKSRSLLVIYFIYSSFKISRTQWKVQNNWSSLQ